MRDPLVNKELRCFCARHPLLATYGLDQDRRLFVHVKIWKQSRIYGEIVVTGGTIQLICRECLRWHRVIIRQPEDMALAETSVPDVVAGVATPVLLADGPDTK